MKCTLQVGVFEHVFPSWWLCLRRFERWGLKRKCPSGGWMGQEVNRYFLSHFFFMITQIRVNSSHHRWELLLLPCFAPHDGAHAIYFKPKYILHPLKLFLQVLGHRRKKKKLTRLLYLSQSSYWINIRLDRDSGEALFGLTETTLKAQSLVLELLLPL